MKIVIDALSQVGAGSRTYLENVLPRLGRSSLSAGWEYVIHWPAGVDLPKGVAGRENLQIRRLPVPQKPALIRLLHQQLIVPFLVRDADLFFAPVDTAPLLCPAPMVLAVRNPNPYYSIERSRMMSLYYQMKKWLVNLSARRSSRVFFVSDHSREHISPQIDLPFEKTRVIHHGLDHAQFKPGEGRRAPEVPGLGRLPDSYLLLVSTITPHKNIEVLLEAYGGLTAALRDKHPVLIAGRIAEEDYFSQLKSLTSSLHIEEGVRFLGEVPYSDIHLLYQGAAVFVLSSHLETFGHTLVEAMACGAPVVASERTAVPEILGGAGILFDPDREEELRKQLKRLLMEPDLAERLSKEGIRRAQDFSWDKTASELEGIFEEYNP